MLNTLRRLQHNGLGSRRPHRRRHVLDVHLRMVLQLGRHYSPSKGPSHPALVLLNSVRYLFITADQYLFLAEKCWTLVFNVSHHETSWSILLTLCPALLGAAITTASGSDFLHFPEIGPH